MGVWIETFRTGMLRSAWCVTPFVGVWIETPIEGGSNVSDASHPSWVCGLKLGSLEDWHVDLESHPSWVCGLKLGK